MNLTEDSGAFVYVYASIYIYNTIQCNVLYYIINEYARDNNCLLKSKELFVALTWMHPP